MLSRTLGSERVPVVVVALFHISSKAGYIATFGLIAIETMGVPVPGETALIASALAAHRGELDIVTLICLAAAAAIIGDNVGFAIGREDGRRADEAQRQQVAAILNRGGLA